MAIIGDIIELKGDRVMATNKTLEILKQKAIEADNSHDAYEYAQAFEKLFKAETERQKAEWDASVANERNAIEQAKADVDAVIRGKQVDCEAERIAFEKARLESETMLTQQKLKSDRINVYAKAGAVIGGAAIFTLAEKHGSLVSKYATQIFKLV